MAGINEKLGERIRKIRRSKKLSQEELAYAANMDYSYLNAIEAGKKNPTVKRVAEIARVLKVTVKDLFDF